MDGLSISGRLLGWIAAVMIVKLWYAPMVNDDGRSSNDRIGFYL